MFRLCCCLVLVFALSAVAEVEAQTTDGVKEGPTVEGNTTQESAPAESETKETEKEKEEANTDEAEPEQTSPSKAEKDETKEAKAKPAESIRPEGRETGTVPLVVHMPKGIADAVASRGFSFQISPEVTELITVPLVVGKGQGRAVEALEKKGFIVVTKGAWEKDALVGNVLSQEPEVGHEAERGSTVALVVAQTEIAIEPGIERDTGTGDVKRWGQLVVHRPFDVELFTNVQNVPLFGIGYAGKQHTEQKGGDRKSFAEARAKTIVANLSVAWDLLDQIDYLNLSANEWIRFDDGKVWQLTGPFRPKYAQADGQYPVICIHNNEFGGNPLRIVTVYPEDARSFGQPADEDGIATQLTEQELAEYIVALIKAHHLLFSKMSTQVGDYERLEICKTREGRIFKEIAIRAAEVAEEGGADALQDALARIALSQRERLMRLAYKVPTDWRVRDN